MAVKQKNPGALIGVVMALIGGVLVFSTFQEFFGGIGIFVDALSYGAEFGVAFDAAIRYTGGQFLVGLLGAILLLIGILTVRSSAGRIARNAAEQGSDAVRRARDEAQQRAEAQQRDNQRRAMEAQQAAQRRVQERRQQVQAGGQGGRAQGGSAQGGQGGQGGQSRLDQLRQRVAQDPRMQQMREAAKDSGYGDLVDRFVPGQPTPNQVRPQQQQPSAQWGGDPQQTQRQTQQPQSPQRRRPQPRQQPQQRGQRQRLQTQREKAESQQHLRQLPDAAAEAAARLAARAREAGMETVMPNDRTAPSKRRSALTRSSLSTSALSKTSLSTNSLFRSRHRQISPAAPISSAVPVEELLQRDQ
ncbi:MAG TPA: hypothetical protein H9830_15240 [Candidatus Agrococcus pullicola]|uniref:Uncharacterized protein n=1 Tax=Candidatus Agrococcus pullicola TaxID=2838429 RepID=A0A9D1YYK2_9MICO|nr:hypothetical protein [Candidatus Agrococcus pullicola]